MNIPITENFDRSRATLRDRDFAIGDADCTRWRLLKLMRHVGAPSVAAFLATEDNFTTALVLHL
jgi:hypothetical protein